MRIQTMALHAAFLLFLSIPSWASHTSLTATGQPTSPAANQGTHPRSRVVGSFTAATQYWPATGDLDGWHSARLGYQLSKNFSLNYVQSFLTDYQVRDTRGPGFRWEDGRLHGRWNKIFAIGGSDVSLEQGLVLPVSTFSRTQGLVLGVSHRFTTGFDVGKYFYLEMEESPTFFWHTTGGSGIGTEGIANLAFRNSICLTPT